MADFFKKFPYTVYEVNNSNVLIRDMFRHVKIGDVELDQIIAHEFHTIGDGERPDNVSQKLYDNPNYDWTFFIINDHLRNTVNNWPLSYRQLQEKIESQYSKYTISIYLPNSTVTPSLTIGSNTYFNVVDVDNSFGGISFTDQILLQGTDNLETAKVLGYEYNNLQLWAYDFSGTGSSFIDDNSSYSLKYEGNGEDRKQWLLSMIDYCKTSSQTIYYTFVEDIANQEITLYSDSYFDLFENTYLTQLVFVPQSQYKYAEYAPRYYFSDEEKTEEISAYDALTSEDQVWVKDYKEVENDMNFDNSQIKYILPSYIGQFSEIFKEGLI